MSHIWTVENYYREYFPPGVQTVIAWGTSCFVGLVDDSTVLKYALRPGGDISRLEIESKILLIVGEHPHIIKIKSFSGDGLYLERAAKGTLFDYLTKSDHPELAIQQRLLWCRELTQAVIHVHSKRVIHCDIQPSNTLLDENLHIKLADFQGNYLSEDGIILLHGESAEPCRFYCPREDLLNATVKTDLFALGCTIYFIMMGYCVFPDIIDGEENWDEKVRDRFEKGQFPEDSFTLSDIASKCWKQQYNSAEEVLREIDAAGKW